VLFQQLTEALDAIRDTGNPKALPEHSGIVGDHRPPEFALHFMRDLDS
jgi:hypothetical protein